MKALVRFALIIGAAGLFAACGGTQLPIGARSALAFPTSPPETTVQYAVLLMFDKDGAVPYGKLLDFKNVLYGTTFNFSGGSYSRGGTVFSLTTGGRKVDLWDFCYVSSCTGPSHPVAGLIAVNDTFYGTTWAGGTHGLGTIFSITTDGTPNVLHNFHNGDGSRPYAGLTYVEGQLYGTTAAGGKAGAGTVFSLNVDGSQYRVLHSFGVGHNGCTHDGCFPYGDLISVKGLLYGTTESGGLGTAPGGTVFSISPSGTKYAILHTFCPGGGRRCSDGTSPETNLFDLNGVLYGTTVTGGSNCRKEGGCGTVFSIRRSGAETVVYSFCANGLPLCSDGEFPYSPLTAIDGTLYGMTYLGGQYNGHIYNRYSGGTVFSLTTSGTETVLHSFGQNEYDGNEPVWSGLTNIGGTLYGTTTTGGTGPCYQGCGTAFALTP